MPLATTGHGCGAVEPLLGIVCSADPTVVRVADCLRIALMCLAACVTALALRAWRSDVDPCVFPGFRDRLGAIMAGCAFVAVTEYDRIGDPVTLRLALGALAVAWSLRSLLRTPDREPPERLHELQ